MADLSSSNLHPLQHMKKDDFFCSQLIEDYCSIKRIGFYLFSDITILGKNPISIKQYYRVNYF